MLEIARDGVLCTPTAPMQRILLGLLLMHRNEYYSTKSIINDLWSYRPPKSAPAALQSYVSAIRRTLLPRTPGRAVDAQRHPVLVTRSAGYILNVGPGEIDIDDFDESVQQARGHHAAGRCEAARDSYQDALAWWRGPALADLRGHSGLLNSADRLDSDRLAVLQERLWLDLRHGRGPQVLGELEELCASHPLNEKLQHQLMVGLAMTGRRADALKVYARTYRAMADEAGLEPGHLLRSAQQAMLGSDSAADFERWLDAVPAGPECGCPNHLAADR
ncbi:hypothetical protein GCM10010172_03330 [Paractinoplanes ferrugineus]|uniref:OmpR/PhoB-type domain-containing protein n=1 Tax=Paractinoplanes ferrugineus TaxID=113564 RepID=A0A919J667_9ACTN|nr:AfsR/SARP family transcriptional regulator [Actinoplanes ferrugineus]GIE13738.1 hypothetical protein Afe05nite_55780 [Actinoplanes ferrugineus]